MSLPWTESSIMAVLPGGGLIPQYYHQFYLFNPSHLDLFATLPFSKFDNFRGLPPIPGRGQGLTTFLGNTLIRRNFLIMARRGAAVRAVIRA